MVQYLDLQDITLEIVKFVLSSVLLLFIWMIGHHLLQTWEEKKRTHEISRDMRREFHNVSGKFKSNIRRWKLLGKPTSGKCPADLLDDINRAEGSVEALLSDISALKALQDEEHVILGLFRQGYQTLHQAIDIQKQRRDDVPSEIRNANYHLFNALTGTIARLFVESRKEPSIDEALQSLSKIMNIRTYHWHDAVELSEKVRLSGDYKLLHKVVTQISDRAK